MEEVERELNEMHDKEIGRKSDEIRMLKEKNRQVESYDQKVLMFKQKKKQV